MVDATSQEQEPRPAPSFKEVLLQSAFSKGRAISNHISEIDLGIFYQEGRALVMQTEKDEKHREFGKIVYVTKDRRILIKDQPTTGNANDVYHRFKAVVTINNPNLPWYLRQDRMCGTILHSHPSDLPPSSEDLFNLLIGDFDYTAEAAVFVSSGKRNFIIFRGNDTPQFTREQASGKISLWENAIQERVMNFINRNTPLHEQMEINNKARTALLRQIQQKYDLKIFFGDANSTKVSLLH